MISIAVRKTLSREALSSYQTFLPCLLHSEVWSCVGISNWKKTKSFVCFEIYKMLKFDTIKVFQVFHFFIEYFAHKFAFLSFFTK